MSTITLQNFRVGSDLTVKVRLKDGGVAIDWSTLSGIRAVLYSDAQSSIAGRCDVTVDGEDPTLLVCRYAATKMQYLGVNRIVVSAKYMGMTKTYDKPAFTFVRWTEDQAGEEITIEDPEVTVEIDVEDVSSSILQEAVDAAFSAADRANEAAEAAEHMVDIHTGPKGDKGDTGETPDISIGTVTTVEPGTPAAASMTGTPEAPVLNLSIPKGLVGATPNFTVGTVTTGEPGSSVIVTITGTPEAPVLNLTIPQGMQGNTGSSVEYPYELVNNLTTNDATKGLSAAQGYVLDGKVSQLEAKVDVKSEVVDLLGTASGASGTLDLSKYTQYDKVISGSSIWEAASVPNCYSRIIPVTPGKYKITASGTTQSIIAFLSAMPVDNQTVSFGTVNGVQTNSRTSIPAGTTNEFTILDTDTSAYLCVRDDASTVLKPTIVYTANVELFVPLNTEFAVVTEETDNIVELQDTTVPVYGTTVETFSFGRIKISGTASSTGGRTTKLCSPFSLPAGSYRLVLSATPLAEVYLETQSGDTIIAQISAPTFTLNAETSVYIGVNVVSGRTYSDYFGIAIFADQNKTEYIPTITAKDLTARKQIADVIAEDNKTGNGVTVTTITPSVTTGKYISESGSIGTSSGFAYTEKFYVEKGKQIYVTARGYSTNVAMIAEVITEDSQYTAKVVSTDSEVHNYTYVVEESGYYAVSYSTAQPCTISILTNTPATLSARIDSNEEILADHETRISECEAKLVGSSVTSLSLSETLNQFIGFDGCVASSNGFAYTEKFYVEKGKQILVKARGYSTNVAMIAKVVIEGSKYDPLVISTDSLVHDYTYLVTESGYYAASYSTAQPRSVVVAENTPSVLSKRIDDISSTDKITKDLYFGIPTIGIIGDSLASGVGYNPNSGSVQEYIEYAWWKVMERRSGRTFKRFCEGGMSTRSFITNSRYGLPVALTSGNECKLYIFALEVNDRSSLGPSYLGSVSDIDLNDPDNNGDTYYGNYARIIQKITAFNPGCKFMLFTNPRTDGDFNDAIRTIAGMFSNCYLVDLWVLYSAYYTSGGFFHQFQDQTAHYPGMAYQAMAKLLEQAIDDCIGDNKSAFDEIQY